VTIGLGKANAVEEVLVTWPDGSTQKLGPVKLDTTTRVEQAQ
jgi:hypothetical protein